MIYIIGIIAGLILPIQTSINTNLGNRIKGTPFIASMVSFLIGTLSLFIIALLKGVPILIPFSTFTNQPYWIWLGGALGVVGLTSNIIIFPYLGAVQTVVMPILGQIIMSMIIDNFGLFMSPEHPFTIMRFVSILILLAGVLMIVLKHNDENKRNKNYLWQILGVIAGMFQATQTPVNGHLGMVLGSPEHAALISFFVGVVILIIISGFTDHGYKKIKNAIGKGNPWWIWLGGALGAIYVMSNAFINPVIGTGTAVILTLLGNLSGGVIFDKFGLMGTTKKNITIIQYLGLLVMILGVVLVHTF
ncbi:DMT family transporter [Apilactobacillus micheneri]|uniref:DMT family transporter n=1 Tax=Apilactobacillus micheneri TaxID=1899430 RepID=UPI002989FC75|nr:DMT family transporter [Apilactobacillus micheneri]